MRSYRFSDGLFAPPNVSLSRKPFIRLRQQLISLEQRDAPASATNDFTAADNDVTDDDISDVESVISDRCKHKITYRLFSRSHAFLSVG